MWTDCFGLLLLLYISNSHSGKFLVYLQTFSLLHLKLFTFSFETINIRLSDSDNLVLCAIKKRLYRLERKGALTPLNGLDGLVLDWLGLDWLRLAWIGSDWLGFAWIGLGWLRLDWLGFAWLGIGLDWLGLAWIGLSLLRWGWIGLDWLRLAWIGLACLVSAWCGLA